MKTRGPEGSRDRRGDALENEFRAMFAERSETVRATTAPYAAVRQRIVAARRKRRMRIGSAGVAFAVAAVGIGVWTTVPGRHQGAVQPGTTDPRQPAAVLYADGRTPIPAGPLQDAALSWLRQNYLGSLAGLTVVTTFDQGVQAAATRQAAAGDTGVAVVDDKNGAILALGGTWNRPLPIADLMKPLALAAAFSTNLYTPESKEPLDAQKHPLRWPQGARMPMTYVDPAGGATKYWPPESPGTQINDVDVTLAQAAQMGANEPFGQLELAPDIAPAGIYNFVGRIGMPKDQDLLPVPSLVLGTARETPLAMAEVYATLLGGGLNHYPRMAEEVLAPGGKVVWASTDSSVPVMSSTSSQEIADILHAALAGPSGVGVAPMNKDDPSIGAMAAAPDTETSAWVTGTDSHYVVSVGVSKTDDNGRLLPVGQDGHGGLDVGSRIAGPTWAQVVRAVQNHG